MKITTKESTNGRISAYYVDGVKTRKCEIDYIVNDNRDSIIEVDYYTRQQFPSLTRSPYDLKLVVTGYYGETLMTIDAACELGKRTGKYVGHDLYHVQDETAETLLQDKISRESKPLDDSIFDFLPAIDELNDVDDAEDEDYCPPPVLETIETADEILEMCNGICTCLFSDKYN